MAKCVQCGFCCRTSLCPYGEWDFTKKECKSLITHSDGTTECAKYNEIIIKPSYMWETCPAFGGGCSSVLFNTDRENILKLKC